MTYPPKIFLRPFLPVSVFISVAKKLYLINDQIPQRNIHSSQGFSIKQETIDYERKLKTSHDNRGENMRKSRELKNPCCCNNR